MGNTESHRHSAGPSVLEGDRKASNTETLITWPLLVVSGLLIGLFAVAEPALAILAVLGLLVLPWAISHIHIVILLLAVYTPFEEFVLK